MKRPLECRRHTGLSQASKFERPLLVVVSKFDEWSQLLGIEDDREPWRTQGDLTAVNIERVESRSSRVRDILARFSPEILTTAESFGAISRSLPSAHWDQAWKLIPIRASRAFGLALFVPTGRPSRFCMLFRAPCRHWSLG